MISTITVTLECLKSIYTNMNLKLEFYADLNRFMKKALCIQPNTKCIECALKDSCHYYKCTGENFQNYPAFLVNANLYVNNLWNVNDQVEITFAFLGKYEIFSEYIQFYFNDHYILKNFIYRLVKLDKEVYPFSIETVEIHNIHLLEDQFIEVSMQKQLAYYQEVYNLSISQELFTLEKRNQIAIDWGPISLATKRVQMNGYYIAYMPCKIKVNSFFLEFGIGKYSYIGGGKVAY